VIKILVDTIRASFVNGVRKSVDVDVYEVRRGNESILTGFEVRTSTGYLATFPEAHIECLREICLKDRGHSTVKHDTSHCHGLHHRKQITAFAKEVAKTYGCKTKNVAQPINAPTRHRRATLSVRDWNATVWAQKMEQAL
jgi:hypothetical protein